MESRALCPAKAALLVEKEGGASPQFVIATGLNSDGWLRRCDQLVLRHYAAAEMGKTGDRERQAIVDLSKGR